LRSMPLAAAGFAGAAWNATESMVVSVMAVPVQIKKRKRFVSLTARKETVSFLCVNC